MDKNDLIVPGVKSLNAWLDKIQPRLNTHWQGAWKGGMVEPGRVLYDHELVLVLAGACRVQVGEEFHELAAGAFLIIPPGVHHATLTQGRGVQRSCLHFDWVPCPRPPSGLPQWVYPPAVPRVRDLKRAPRWVPPSRRPETFNLQGRVPPLLETLRHRWQTGAELDRATCHAILHELLLHLLWRGTQRPALGNRATQLAYQVKELLDRTMDADDPVQPLLASLGFSYAHLSRLFRAKFGVSPLRYRNASKLERAKNLLRDPKLTIAEAAYAAGFNDPAYFSRKFHAQHGASPSQLR